MQKKDSHSKASDLIYDTHEVQNYLKSDNNLSNDEKHFLFKLRTRMTYVKTNFKNNFNDLKCTLGCTEDEKQKIC